MLDFTALEGLQIIKRNTRSVIFTYKNQCYAANQYGAICAIATPDSTKIDWSNTLGLSYALQTDMLRTIGYIAEHQRNSEPIYNYNWDAIIERHTILLEDHPDSSHARSMLDWAKAQKSSATN